MRTEIESDSEGYLYIFGRMLKSEGHKVTHNEGRIEIEMEGSKFEIEKAESSFEVTGDSKKFLEHMKSVFRAEDEDEASEKLRSLGIEINE